MSSTDTTSHVQISSPVLQSATSSRVSPSLKETTVYSSTSDLLKTIHQKQSSQERLHEAGIRRIQTKYASPDNLLGQTMNAQRNVATLEVGAPKLLPPALPPTKNRNSSTSSGINGGSVVPVVTVSTPGINGGSSAFSDASSDISDSNTSPSNAGTSVAAPVPVVEMLTEKDINQIDLFYRSHKTDVRVCKSLANLYLSVAKVKDRATVDVSIPEPQKNKSKRSSKYEPKPDPPQLDSPDPSEFSKDEWEFAKTGIPVLVLDTGEHLRDRKLTILLAERGTGFTLWSDVVNHLTKYSTPHTNFHTISLSTDSTRLVGLSFDEGKAATEFAETVKSLTANPDDELLNLSSKKKSKKKEKEKKPKYKPPKKVDISQPCCFVHVTKLERPDFLGIPVLAFPPPPSGSDLTRETIRRALSQSSSISDVSTTPSDHRALHDGDFQHKS